MLFMLAAHDALAADPDLNGAHLALGGGIVATIDSDGVLAPSAELGARLHCGTRVTLDFEGAGGGKWSDSITRSQELTDEGEAQLRNASGEDLSGWSVEVGGRLLVKATGVGPDGFFIGVHGAWSTQHMSGPRIEEVDDADGVPVETKVGKITERDVGGAVGPSLEVVHWLSDRVALSGLTDLGVYAVSSQSSEELRTDGDTDFLENVSEKHGSALGLWPRVGISLHLLL